MRRAGAGLIAVAAAVALAGCKGTTPKPADGREPIATPAGRTKGKNNAWLDDPTARLPGGGAAVPKGGSFGDPKAPGFDATREARGVVAGRVIGPDGQGARGVYIRIEPADAAPGDKDTAPAGILANDDGYFSTNVLTPGRTYTLSVEASAGGKPVYGSVQTRPPQATVTIALRDDLPPPAGGSDLPVPENRGLTPPARPNPFPSRPENSRPTPPARPDVPPDRKPAAPPADGAYTPGVGATSRPLPATIPNPSGPTGLPPAAPTSDAQPAVPVRPESTATSPPSPFKPQPLSIPNPATPVPTPNLNPPPVPALPPPIPPPAGTPEKKSARPVKPGANFALVDDAGRPWDLATGRAAPVVLVEFLTTTCVPCKKAVPGLIDLQERYGAAGLEVVGVVCDEVAEPRRRELAAKYQADQRLNYALYVEPVPGEVRDRRFAVASYPTAVLLDDEGNPVWKGNPAGDRAGLEAAVRKALGK